MSCHGIFIYLSNVLLLFGDYQYQGLSGVGASQALNFIMTNLCAQEN